jgi:opacity protein-like surface antigen
MVDTSPIASADGSLYKATFGFNAQYRYAVAPKLSLGASVGYSRPKVTDSGGGSFIENSQTVRIDYEFESTLMIVPVHLYVEYRFATNRVQPFVGLGLGATATSWRIKDVQTSNVPKYQYATDFKDLQVDPSGVAEMGIRVGLTDKLALQLMSNYHLSIVSFNSLETFSFLGLMGGMALRF